MRIGKDKGLIWFAVVMLVVAVGGVYLHEPVDQDLTLRERACAAASEIDPPTETSKTVLGVCSASDGSWGDAVWRLEPPMEYTARSGFIERPMRVDGVKSEGFFRGIVCADDKYRWNSRQARLPGDEWTPDVRRRLCRESFADPGERYALLSGPDANHYYIAAVEIRDEVYVGWTHIQMLEREEVQLLAD